MAVAQVDFTENYVSVEQESAHWNHSQVTLRVPTVLEKHGKAWKKILSWKVMEKSWKMGQQNKVMEIQKCHGKVMEKSWNFSTAYRESRMRNSDNSISIGLLQCFGYGRLSVYVLNSTS